MNSGQEISGELVVSGGDAAEVLEPTKAALDDVSAFIGSLVEGMDYDAVRFVGDDRLGAATYDFAAKVVAVIPFVAEERAHCQSAFKFDPVSASNFDPFERRVLTVALAWSELAGVAETRRARVA